MGHPNTLEFGCKKGRNQVMVVAGVPVTPLRHGTWQRRGAAGFAGYTQFLHKDHKGWRNIYKNTNYPKLTLW